MGRAKWIFWIVVILAIIYGLLKIFTKIAWFAWSWQQIKKLFGKGKKKEVDNSELEKEARKENKIEIVKEKSQNITKKENIVEVKKEKEEEFEIFGDEGELLRTRSAEEILKEESITIKKEEPKKEPANTPPKSFVEELKEKVQPGETNLKPSDFKKKAERKKLK